MELLIRELVDGRPQGAFVDRELNAAKVTVGCANDQLLQLFGTEVRPQHAVLTPTPAGLRVRAVGGGRIAVNGALVREAKLEVGDGLQVGGHTLVVVPAPAGFDAALELSPDPDVDPASFEQAFQTALNSTWLSKRTPAWTVSALVLIFGLLLPLALLLDGDDTTPVAGARMLTDAYWSSGPLHPAHQLATGDDCGACHEVPFQQVRDSACRACHTDLNDHFPATHYAAGQTQGMRCAVCHVEHNEPSFLIVKADGLCLDCHAHPGSLSAGKGHLQAVHGFDAEHHPAFEVGLLVPEVTASGTGLKFSWHLQEALLAGASERSNLKFPHDVHLDPETVRTVQGDRAMQCGDCHTLTADNEHFAPIVMETHCQSCHELTFDDSAPQRQLPHGQPAEVIQVMEGHFALQYADPDQRDKARSKRRLPGRPQAQRGCVGDVYECAMQRTALEVNNQFTVRGCITCHTVEQTTADDLYSRYQVYPIRLSHDFFPTAVFDHRSHLTQKGVQGDQACLTCHAAQTSKTSTDLLIPDLDNCVQCHTDRHTANTVPLDCVNCHEYHPAMPEPINYLERHL